jgi:hypothetical protein
MARFWIVWSSRFYFQSSHISAWTIYWGAHPVIDGQIEF